MLGVVVAMGVDVSWSGWGKRPGGVGAVVRRGVMLAKCVASRVAKGGVCSCVGDGIGGACGGGRRQWIGAVGGWPWGVGLCLRHRMWMMGVRLAIGLVFVGKFEGR